MMTEKTATEPVLATAHTRMGILLREFFDELNSEGIGYCVLRHYETLPDFTTNDVDLMVESESIALTISVLQQLATTQGWRIVRLNRRFQFLSLFLLWTGIETDAEYTTLKIDIWWGNTQWKAVPSVSSKTVLQTSWVFRGFRVASAGPSSAVIWTKEYLQFGKLGTGVKELRNKELLIKSIQSDRKLFQDTLEVGFGRRTAEKIADHIASEDWKWFERQYRRIQLALIARSLLRRPLHQIRDWYLFVRSHLIDKIVYPNGLFIAFCGPDGSGKTTISRGLETKIVAHLSALFPVVHHRHGRFGFIPDLKVVYNFFSQYAGFPKKEELSVEDAVKMLDAPPYSIPRATIYLAYYAIDFLFGHFMIVRARAAGHIVLFDRYYYDYLAHRTYERIPVSLRRALFTLFPQPQILIFLSGNAEDIHRRKPELAVEQINVQQAVFARIIHSAKNGHVCNTDSAVEETLMCVLDELTKNLEQYCLKKLGKHQQL